MSKPLAAVAAERLAERTGELPDDPEALKERVRAAENRVSVLEAELRRAERRATRHAVVVDRIVEAVQAHLAGMPMPRPPAAPARDKRRKRELTAVLHCSDWHIGQVTSTYDTATAERRVARLTENAIDIVEALRSAHPIRELRIYLGGDMVEHESKRPGHAFEVDSPVYAQATHLVPALLSGLVRQMLGAFERVSIKAVPGNHGWSRSDPAHHFTSNWDHVAYRCAQLMLCQDPAREKLLDRLSFEIRDTWWFVDRVYEYGNLVVHGNEMRGGFAGYPWYSVGRRALRWLDSIPEPWDHLWLGHFHTLAEAVLNYHLFLSNGSLVSDDEYAKQELGAAGCPVQRLAFFSEPLGLIYNCPVYVDSERRSQTERWQWWAERQKEGGRT